MKTLIISLAITGFLTYFSTAKAQQTNLLNDAKTILVVMDMQEHFLTEEIKDSASDSLLEEVNWVINSFPPEQIVYVTSIMRVLSVSFSGKSIDTLPGMNLDVRLKSVNDQVFNKIKPDAFTSSDFSAFLMEKNIEKLVFVGLMAEHCISATVNTALKKGFEVYLVPEAICGKTTHKKEKALRQLQRKGAQFLSIR
jgi:nicotinamidase-related amidase